MARTLLDRIWEQHAVEEQDGYTLLFFDRHLLHEGSRFAFNSLNGLGRRVKYPELTFAFADHYVPTTQRDLPIADPEQAAIITNQEKHCQSAGIRLFGLSDPRQGIVHVVGPEEGLILPGLTVACGDSHTTTLGAFGALAFGIGSWDATHIMATQALWMRKPKSFRIELSGDPGKHVTAKDVVLALIGEIGADGGVGHVLEYTGTYVSELPMEARMTLCNMAVEAGARSGLIAADAVTEAFLRGRTYSPDEASWDRARQQWARFRSDVDATHDRRFSLDVSKLAPMVTWGTSPQWVAPIDGKVPDPDAETDAGRREAIAESIAYMDLKPGHAMTDIALDRVFIGSCTNARLSDLRAAAAVLKGKRAKVPGIVVPGSQAVKRDAESERLDVIFREAGLEWREPGCSMCLAVNGDRLAPGERSASTSNRNFRGRQGPGSRTHLLSPAMAAAAAVAGRLVDVREFDHAEI